jgi:hypothetical protein
MPSLIQFFPRRRKFSQTQIEEIKLRRRKKAKRLKATEGEKVTGLFI